MRGCTTKMKTYLPAIIRMIMSCGFWWENPYGRFPGYCGAEIGYRWRTQAPSDEFRYLLEFGVNATQGLSFTRVKLDGTKSMHNADLPHQPKPVNTAYIDEETGQVIKTSSSVSPVRRSQQIRLLASSMTWASLNSPPAIRLPSGGSVNCHTPIIPTEKMFHPAINIPVPWSIILTIKKVRRHR